jgi:GTP-binding protein
MSSPPVVAIVGRPNVGKSTLINRIIGRRDAIVRHNPGVTRDRVVYETDWAGKPFSLIDSGGLEVSPAGDLAGKVATAARDAAREADVVVLVVDVAAGLTAEDHDVAAMLRRIGRRVVLAANKADNDARRAAATELFELGLGEPFAVSALHGTGVGDLLDEVARDFDQADEAETQVARIAIVGRPNAGKSSLFNRLAGSERSIVHAEPGTTRDTVDTVLEADGELFRFLDTAGMRRLSKVDDQTEYYAVVRTMRTLDTCDVALIALDANEPLARQDLRICERTAELGRSAVLVLTKADLVSPEIRRARINDLRRRVAYLDFAPVLVTSAVTGEGTGEVLPTLRRVLEGRGVRVPTPELNAVIEDLQARTPVPSKRAHTRVKYAVQAEVAPPRIVLFGASRLPEAWLRHLERGLRDRFGFEGTPIHFVTRGGQRRTKS